MVTLAERVQELDSVEAGAEDLETAEYWQRTEEEIWRARWDYLVVGNCHEGVASRTFSNRWWDSRRVAVAEEVVVVAMLVGAGHYQIGNVLPPQKFGSPALHPSRMSCCEILLADS